MTPSIKCALLPVSLSIQVVVFSTTIYYTLYYICYIYSGVHSQGFSLAGTLLHCGSLYNHNVFLDFILLSKWSPTVLPPLPSLTHSQLLTTQFLLTSQKFMGFKESKFCLLFFLLIPICMAFN